MSATQPISILVVDDQPRNVIALEAALSGVDCRVVTAQSGRDALGKVLEQDFAVILLDVRMPGMDGFETAGLIRAREHSRSTPIMFMTAYDSGGIQAHEGYRLGGIDYLYKPFDADILRSKVAFFVELFRQSAELARLTTELVDREQQVSALNADLERRVIERTTALAAALSDLEAESGERQRTEAALRELEHAAAGRAVALAEVSRVLVENFMDHRPILGRVAQIAAAAIDAACVIQLSAEEDGDATGLVTLAVEHPDPAVRAELTRCVSGWQTLANSPWLDLEPIFITAYPLMDTLLVPMVARTARIGVLALGRFGSTAARFSDSDRRFSDDVATRIALAVDNARLYEKAGRAIALRDDFLIIAAHELKTPLTAIQGYSQLLSHQLEDGLAEDVAPVQRAASMIEDRARHLARLVEQILDVTGLVASRLEIDFVETDLVALIRRLVATFAPRHEPHDFRLHFQHARMNAVVDPPRLEQVMSNLIDNAVRYSPDGAPIDITVEERGDRVSLAVRDRGLGIPEEHRLHLFERFHQAHAADHRSGMGLGLHISREIVALHGGEITVAFPVDGGSLFTVLLPRTIASAPVTHRPAR